MADLRLGEKYRDKVSGWGGILTARYEYLNGCVRVELSAKDKDGEPKAFVFDEEQVELVADAPAVEIERRKTGGPQSNRPVAR